MQNKKLNKIKKINWRECNNPDDLREKLHISYHELSLAQNYTNKYYIRREDRGIDKSPRVIYCPRKPLKKVQKAILSEIFNPILMPSYVHSCKYKSIITNATVHIGKEAVAVFDMKDFFPSIKAERVRSIYEDIGFNRRLTGMLTRLTTVDNYLQQGLPTSTAIANIAAKDLDEHLQSWCAMHGLNYTRYVDDITISGDISSMRGISDFVMAAIEEFGFDNSPKKHKIMTQDTKQIVTGIIVNTSLEISDEYQNEIIIGIDDFIQQISSIPDDAAKEYYRQIHGSILFCRNVDRFLGDRLLNYLRKSLENAGYLSIFTRSKRRKKIHKRVWQCHKTKALNANQQSLNM